MNMLGLGGRWFHRKVVRHFSTPLWRSSYTFHYIPEGCVAVVENMVEGLLFRTDLTYSTGALPPEVEVGVMGRVSMTVFRAHFNCKMVW